MSAKKTTRGDGRRQWLRWALLGPYFWLLLFFLAPFIIILKISVADPLVALPPFTDLMNWSASGAAVGNTADEVCRWSVDEAGAAKVNVFPILVVGDASFTTIGFQTDGKMVKFRITHKKPGPEVADRNDPYGEVGFYSIKWYYGFMQLRPERIALLKTVATL